MAEHDNDSDPADGDDDVNDDELEQLARINAEFSSNNQPEKSIEPKGTMTIDILFSLLTLFIQVRYIHSDQVILINMN